MDVARTEAWSPRPTSHPHANTIPKKITVDREANRVFVEYVRDGHTIKETWRIAGVEVGY